MSTKKKTTFLSTGPNQQVVIDPGQPQLLDVSGAVIQKHRPIKVVDFANNRLDTDDPAVIKRLREDALFQRPNGWWEEGNAPDEPKPTRTDQQKAIVKATAAGDVEALETIRDEERANHNRFDVIESAEVGISAITVPAAENAGAVHRTDLPAERGEVPKIDAPQTAEGNPLSEVDAERVARSEDVARERANAQAAGKVDEKIDAELEVVQSPKAPEGEKLAEKMADAGKVKPAPKKKSAAAGPKGQRKSASKSTASGVNDGDSGDSKK